MIVVGSTSRQFKSRVLSGCTLYDIPCHLCVFMPLLLTINFATECTCVNHGCEVDDNVASRGDDGNIRRSEIFDVVVVANGHYNDPGIVP